MKIKSLSDLHKQWWKAKPKLPMQKLGSWGIMGFYNYEDAVFFKVEPNDGAIWQTLKLHVNEAKELYLFLKEFFD